VVIGGSARMIDGAPAGWALDDMRQDGARAAAVIARQPRNPALSRPLRAPSPRLGVRFGDASATMDFKRPCAPVR
jgi:hypothetical protein